LAVNAVYVTYAEYIECIVNISLLNINLTRYKLKLRLCSLHTIFLNIAKFIPKFM